MKQNKLILLQIVITCISSNYLAYHHDHALPSKIFASCHRFPPSLSPSGIPSYWDFQSNLLWSMKEGTRQNIKGFLNRMVKEMEASKDRADCRDVWAKYFY